MMSQTQYCPRHPRTQTNLRCGKCGELVCPQCLVHTPVGVRCRDCARISRIPTFDVTWPFILRAVAAGAVIAIGLGVLFVFLAGFILGIPFAFPIFMIATGFVIGEGISLAVNRKRGRVLKYIAAGSVVVTAAFVFIAIPVFSLFSIFRLLALAIAIYVAVNRF